MSKLNNSIYYIIVIIVLTFILTVLILSSKESISPNSISLDTRLGTIQGVLLSRKFRQVSAFYGIPFAESPVGELRFKKPIPHKGWKKGDFFDASSLPPACIQNVPVKKVPESEDCLYLNVYVPGNAAIHVHDTQLLKNHSSPKKAVMVWIYGGSFVMGSIRDDHSMLASFGDVIVVDIAYRLGIFGYLISPREKVIDTNVGLFDQSLALRWVYDNIESFGGDKEKITIFGESAGGISVGFHLISDHSKPFFQKAILESGAPSPSGLLEVNIDPLNVDDVSLLTGCFDEPTDEGTMSCLQKQPVEKLKQVQETLMILKKTNAVIPKFDNDFLKMPIREFYENGSLFAPDHKEIMIGVNGMEGASFIWDMFPDLFPEKGPVNEKLTWDSLRFRINRNHPGKDDDLNTLFDAMNADMKDTPGVIAQKFAQVIGDMVFVCPSISLSKSFVKRNSINGNKGHYKVFFYEYNHRPSDINDTYPWALNRALHTEEVPIVFGKPFLEPDLWTNEERALSKRIMSMWVKFAKDDTPTIDSKKWTGIEDQKNSLGYLKVKTDTTIEFVSGSLPENRCSALKSLLR